MKQAKTVSTADRLTEEELWKKQQLMTNAG